jgi:transposase InsO family protein
MARENPVWGEERIASEFLVKLGIRVSPRTVRKYMPKPAGGQPRGDQRWSTFLKNHSKAIVACDFFVAVTATFRQLYVLVVIEHGSRRLARVEVTAHPTAAWTLQQLREVVGFEHVHRYLIHDRDGIFARHLDESIKALGLSVLKSPPHCPKANAICERVIGTIRRECLDWLIPMSEGHLRSMLKSWVKHYNCGRPHSSRGPGVPDPPPEFQVDSRRVYSCSLNRFWAACITSICSQRRQRVRNRWLKKDALKCATAITAEHRQLV